jgi:hypothetical protein
VILPRWGIVGKYPYSMGVVDEEGLSGGVWIKVNSIGRLVTMLSPLTSVPLHTYKEEDSLWQELLSNNSFKNTRFPTTLRSDNHNRR